MISRRSFIKKSSVAGIALGMYPVMHLFAKYNRAFAYQSNFIKLQLDPGRPKLTWFSTDSLGHAQFGVNPLLDEGEAGAGTQYTSKIKKNGIAYYRSGESSNNPAWEFKCSRREITVRTQWKEGEPVAPFLIPLSQKLNYTTVLGAVPEKNQASFPCVLHLPGMGTFRIHCSEPAVPLWYDAYRFDNAKEQGEPFIKLAFKGADATQPDITYRFESVSIYPEIAHISKDPRFAGFRRNYINIFQMNPRIQVLANNSASDVCAFTLYLYAEMARKTPALANGLTAMDLVRNSLEQYLSGMKAYGQVGYKNGAGWASEYDASDSAPSLIISACYYILDTKDIAWGKKNYAGIKQWVDEMIATDRNKDGIIEYGYSGNAGSWNDKAFKLPSNWWDTIGFGHDDAYANALAYRAYTLLATVAADTGHKEDSAYFTSFAAGLKRSYYQHFYNPGTGLLAGWKSEDGQLHDYCFTFVNSVAICYGLLEEEQAKRIMQALLAKMKAVGYTDFRLGLPGNLIPVRSEDYVHHDRRWGYGKNEDALDGFQIYENGGATVCFAYFTIKALYQLQMNKEAGMILLPMLESFRKGDFEGRCPGSEMTRDWKTWSGECWGYEGFLVDNYLTLLAVTDYQ